MPVIVGLLTGIRELSYPFDEDWGQLGDIPVVDEGSFLDVQKLAPVSIFAAAVIFKIDAYFGFVVSVEFVFVPEFVFSVGEGALT